MQMKEIDNHIIIYVQDGRPEIGPDDKLLARLRKIHRKPRYDLAVPLSVSPTS
jgi:hypothetical protein